MRQVYNPVMPILYVQFKGAKDKTAISVGSVDDDGRTLIIKDEEGKLAGSVSKDEIAGWWIRPDPGV